MPRKKLPKGWHWEEQITGENPITGKVYKAVVPVKDKVSSEPKEGLEGKQLTHAGYTEQGMRKLEELRDKIVEEAEARKSGEKKE